MIDENAGSVSENLCRPGVLTALCAPMLGVGRVGRATSLLTRASAFQLAIVLLVYVAIEASLCVGMALWEDTVRFDYSMATTKNVGSPPWEVRSRSLAEVWSEWKGHRRGNPAVVIFTGVAFGTLAAVLIAIALFWPRVYRHGRLRPALRRTQGAVLAASGLAIVLTAIVFSGFITIRHWNMWHGMRWGGGLQEGQFLIIGIQSSILLMLLNLSRAARAACDLNYAPEPPPLCEGCGYDLTHRPESGACPECGTSVEKSLEPGRGRRPSEFDRNPSLPDAISTTLRALLSPSTFYRQITVRIEPQRDALFRIRHYVAIFVGAFVWICILMLATFHGTLGLDEFTGLLAGSMGAVIVSWALQHLVGSVVCLMWVVKRTLPDMRWGVRVLNFDTVYLWLFCLFNGTMITSFVVFEDWIGELFGHYNQPTGLPTPFLAMAIPNLTLVGYWIVRLLRGGRAVQWANF